VIEGRDSRGRFTRGDVPWSKGVDSSQFVDFLIKGHFYIVETRAKISAALERWHNTERGARL